jgi:5-hydroxyisourate hydrolase-like protein (transthyretin family)
MNATHILCLGAAVPAKGVNVPLRKSEAGGLVKKAPVVRCGKLAIHSYIKSQDGRTDEFVVRYVGIRHGNARVSFFKIK